MRERFLFELATDEAIVERVAAVLGDDVVLWGISAVRRAPGQVHPWHTDIESSAPEGGFASVWIGLENTSRDASLQLISGSHRLGRTVQEARAELRVDREGVVPDELLRIAREDVPEARLVVPEMTDGDAVFFDGRLWHGTDNRRERGDRVALVLQYASADSPVRIPDWRQLDWPFRLRTEPRPPVVPVSGAPRRSVNRIAPPPVAEPDTRLVRTVVHEFDIPLETEPTRPWRPYPAFAGRTGSCDQMSCHASILAGDHSPHAPHAHVEEELLIALRGEAELVIPSGPSDTAPRVERLRPGSFVYYPAWQHHTIRNPGSDPIVYAMFKWRAAWIDQPSPLDTRIEEVGAPSLGEGRPFRSHLVLEGPTDYLEKLHAHVSRLEPGAGYEPHLDSHDVAIVTLEGAIDTLGQRVGPGSVVFYAAGELHGMRNTGPAAARYLVFELHRPQATASPDGTERRARGLDAHAIRRARALRP